MKHSITKFFTRLALVAGLATVFASSAWATDFTLSSASSVTKDGITISFDKASGSNAPAWYAAGLRLYANNTITIVSSNTITGVTFNWEKQGSKAFASVTANTGSYSHPSNTGVGTWTGSATSITFTLGSSGQLQLNTLSVTASSSASSYTVTYNSNGGSGTMTDSNSPYASGATVTVLSNTFTRSGYSFSNWNTAADGSGAEYDAGDTFTISANTTLYAQWASNAVATTTTISADGITNTDVYVNTAAGSLSATVRDASKNTISGASVTWSGNNDDVATINASTGAVTLVGAGNVTFTATYAGVENQYQGSTDTYEMTVTSSAPFTGGDITFIAGTDVGSTTTNNSSDEVTKSVVSISCTDAAFATADYRFYKNSVATITTSEGVITKIVFSGTSDKPASGFASQTGWVTSGNDGTWTGSETSVSFTASGAQVRATKIVVTVDLSVVPDPDITAANVSIAYDETGGSIAYEVSNPVTGAAIQASIASGATISNMAIGTITDRVVPFTCDANATNSARTATVTLNYVKDNEVLATKNVTVTQAAAPVIYSTIPALFAAATSTETEVHVTFNNWVVSGVSTNGKNVFVTDNSGNGFVIFDNTGGLGTTYSVGAILSGANVTCNLVLYNGFAEIKSLDPSDLNITTGGSVSTANIAMADLAGVNTGALVSYQDLVCSIDNNKYYLSDGTTTLQVYNAIYAFGALESGKHYNITGIYQQYNSTKEILPRSAADIEEVVITVPTITVAPATANHLASEESGSLSLAFENLTISDKDDFGIVFYDAEGNELSSQNEPGWIAVEIDNADPGSLSFVVSYIMDPNTVTSPRTAYFKVFAFDDNSDIVYSNLVTITQAAYVIDYAELPFEWAGGTSAELGALVGVTTSGLGSDYAASNAPYRVKLDGEGDYILIKTDSRPGKVSIGVKMLGGTNTSKIKVQGSADGETFTDVEELTISGSSNTTELNLETSNDFAADARYVKIIKSVHGSNVGVGPITIAEYVAPAPSITLSPAAVGVAAVAASGGKFNGTLAIRYSNLPITKLDDFEVIFCDSEGEELQSGEEPDWILIDLAEDNGAYVVSYVIDDNDGAVRRAYIKVWALDEDGEEVYSNLVTITQSEYVAPPTPGNWVLTSLADLTADDVFVIVNDKDERASYAMSNDNGASVAPDAVEVSVLNGTLTGVIPANIRWNVRGNAIDGYVFYPDGSTESWLYCTNTNNGVRVGVGEAKHFTLEDGYLTTSETTEQRYLGVYKTQDWRCYTSPTSTNIANQSTSFYKKQVPADAEATITVNAAYHDGRYWATFYNAGAQYELPEGAQAFTMNEDHELYRLGDKGNLIPENTAVIILTDMGEIPANGVIPATKQITLTLNNHGAAAVHGGENILRGSSSPKALTSVGGTPYVMGINNEGEAPKLGFFPYNGTGDDAYIPANKAYYVDSE